MYILNLCCWEGRVGVWGEGQVKPEISFQSALITFIFSLKIATKIAEEAYEDGTASTYPEPKIVFLVRYSLNLFSTKGNSPQCCTDLPH